MDDVVSFPGREEPFSLTTVYTKASMCKKARVEMESAGRESNSP